MAYFSQKQRFALEIGGGRAGKKEERIPRHSLSYPHVKVLYYSFLQPRQLMDGLYSICNTVNASNQTQLYSNVQA